MDKIKKIAPIIFGFMDIAYCTEFKKSRKHNFSEIGFVSVLRSADGSNCPVGSLRES
jgi:hypothetical protein